MPSLANMSDEKRLEILYEHYKSVVEHNRNNVRYRYRYLFYILVVVMLVLLEVFFPEDAQSFISGFLANIFDLPHNANFQIIETGLLFALMLLIVRYLQLVVTVERQYTYIHWLEDRLNEFFGEELITFEGKFYGSNYPPILGCLNLVYKYCVPAIFVSVVILQIEMQIPVFHTKTNLISYLNSAVRAIIVISVGLYGWFLIKQNIVGKIIQCIGKKVMQIIPDRVKQLASKIIKMIQNILNKINQCADSRSQQADKQTTTVAEYTS